MKNHLGTPIKIGFRTNLTQGQELPGCETIKKIAENCILVKVLKKMALRSEKSMLQMCMRSEMISLDDLRAKTVDKIYWFIRSYRYFGENGQDWVGHR